MLRFAASLDSVMTAILATALESRADCLDDEYLKSKDIGLDWRDECPGSSKSLTLTQIIEQLRALRTALLAPTVYMPTDLHFLLMHEALEIFIELHNEVNEEPIECPELHLGPYQIETISFEDIEDIFFWDLDFLFDPATARAMTPAMQAMMDYSDSARRVSMGQKATPEDLRLDVSDDPTVLPPQQAPVRFQPAVSNDYPYSDDQDDEDDLDDEA